MKPNQSETLFIYSPRYKCITPIHESTKLQPAL